MGHAELTARGQEHKGLRWKTWEKEATWIT